jgi:hypothetical protein
MLSLVNSDLASCRIDVELLHQSSGKKFAEKQKRILENAKQELRDVFGRA